MLASGTTNMMSPEGQQQKEQQLRQGVSPMEREDEAATALLIRHLTGEARSSIASLSSAALLGASDRDLAALGDGSKSLRGPWGYRVGLVGKPSAGKSSLFNALTRAGFMCPPPPLCRKHAFFFVMHLIRHGCWRRRRGGC